MRLKVNNFDASVIVYGEGKKAKSLYDLMIALGLRSVYIFSGEDNTPDCGPQMGSSINGIKDIENAFVVAMPVNGFGRAKREIEDAYPQFKGRVVRDIEFLSELILQAELIDPPVVKKSAQPVTFLGMNLGFVMGGLETWVAELYHELIDEGVNVKLLETIEDNRYIYVGPESYGIEKSEVLQIGPYDDFISYALKVVELFCEYGPSVFIDNGSLCTMAGLYLAKARLHMPIKVISVIHGDAMIFYNRLKMFHEVIDKIITVSEELHDKVIEILPQRAADVKAKVKCPMPQEASLSKKRTDGVLHIAYAARLDAWNKRSLWLKDVAGGLCESGIPFMLHVAGDGECLEELKSFVRERGLEEQMILYGLIDHDKMGVFYQDKHVFINFSKAEGGPLTLFESMAHGLVPVVTDAGSAKRLITDGMSGYIIASPEETVARLTALAGNPALLKSMGQNAFASLKDFREEIGSFTADFL